MICTIHAFIFSHIDQTQRLVYAHENALRAEFDIDQQLSLQTARASLTVHTACHT